MGRIKRFNESNKIDDSYYDLGTYDWFLNHQTIDSSKIETCLQELIDDSISFSISLDSDEEYICLKFRTNFTTGKVKNSDPMRDFSRFLDRISYPIESINNLPYFDSTQTFIFSEYGYHIVETMFQLKDEYKDFDDDILMK